MRPPVSLQRLAASCTRSHPAHATSTIQPNHTHASRDYASSSHAASRVKPLPLDGSPLRVSPFVAPFLSTWAQQQQGATLTTQAAAPIAQDTTSSNQNQNDNKNNKNTKAKAASSVGDVFLDHMGKIFLACLAAIILMLVRSSKSQTHQNTLRAQLENSAWLDPLELDDLRTANAPHFNKALFEKIMARVVEQFGSVGRVGYREFVGLVSQVCREHEEEDKSASASGSGGGVQLGHLLDRVALGVLGKQQQQQQQQHHQSTKSEENSFHLEQEQENDCDEDDTLSLSMLLAILSLALCEPPEERMKLLFQVAAVTSNSTSSQSSRDEIVFDTDTPPTTNASNATTISKQDVQTTIENLQQTNQLPPGPQILLDAENKYPVQLHKVGLAEELMVQDSKSGGRKEVYDLEEFMNVLCSGHVCAWGECYNPQHRLRQQKKKQWY